MEKSVRRNRTKPPTYPFIIQSVQRAKDNKQLNRAISERNQLPEPRIFSVCEVFRPPPVERYLRVRGRVAQAKNDEPVTDFFPLDDGPKS